MSLRKIKLVASAVRAGQESAKRGDVKNPFEGVNEELRLAFHLGWTSEQPAGETFLSVEAMLRAVQRTSHLQDGIGISPHSPQEGASGKTTGKNKVSSKAAGKSWFSCWREAIMGTASGND